MDRHVVAALTIAGSDPSGGAGIQADLKTFHQHGVYGASAITLLTVQNTQRVSRVETMSPDLVVEQIDAVLEDIRPEALKTGALGSAVLVRAVAGRLLRLSAGERPIPLVIDPVMISKHGHALLEEEAVDACVEHLFPLATLLTPNVPEAERLLSYPHPVRIRTVEELEDAARTLSRRFGVAVLVKGGHLEDVGERSVDVLGRGLAVRHYSAPRLETRHTHGTGCTFSAAITARLALGAPLEVAIEGAKAWLTRAIGSAPGIGLGIGPVDHFAPIE